MKQFFSTQEYLYNELFIKRKTYEEAKKSSLIKISEITDERTYKINKTTGIGRKAILKFLNGIDNWENGSWKEWMVQDALATIQDSEDRIQENKKTGEKKTIKATIDREAVEEFPTTKQATTFKRAVQTYEVPKHKQKELAKEIIKEGRDSTREIKDAVKEKAIESKKSKALTVKDKRQIEEDLEIKELEEMCKNVSNAMNRTTCDISDLLHKFQKMEVTSFRWKEILGFKNNFDSLISVVIKFAPYFNYTISKEEHDDEE